MHYPRVLTIQDISCAGQCSMTVALPVLSACGVETCVLPTAVLSTHTGGLGKPHIRDLTEDLPQVAAHWKQAGIRFDVISCGYLGSVAQMDCVSAIFEELIAPGGITVLDPAMADHGNLYAGFDAAFVAAMKEFCSKADYLLPNITEACLLTGTEYCELYDRAWIDGLMERMSAMGCRNVILTGVSFDRDTTGVMVNGSYLAHERLEQNCHGTGDLCAAAFAGGLARGKSALQAAELAASYTLSCMKLTAAENTRPYGVMFEPLLPELIRALET